jgi:hypothetical protein
MNILFLNEHESLIWRYYVLMELCSLSNIYERGPQSYQTFKSHLKILGIRWVT